MCCSLIVLDQTKEVSEEANPAHLTAVDAEEREWEPPVNAEVWMEVTTKLPFTNVTLPPSVSISTPPGKLVLCEYTFMDVAPWLGTLNVKGRWLMRLPLSSKRSTTKKKVTLARAGLTLTPTSSYALPLGTCISTTALLTPSPNWLITRDDAWPPEPPVGIAAMNVLSNGTWMNAAMVCDVAMTSVSVMASTSFSLPAASMLLMAEIETLADPYFAST